MLQGSTTLGQLGPVRLKHFTKETLQFVIKMYFNPPGAKHVFCSSRKYFTGLIFLPNAEFCEDEGYISAV
jgi:hypothetical protein